MSKQTYKSRIADDGTIEYVVGDVIVTRSEQEAIDLTQTGVFQLSDELTLSLLQGPQHEYRNERVREIVAGVEVEQVRSFIAKVR